MERISWNGTFLGRFLYTTLLFALVSFLEAELECPKNASIALLATRHQNYVVPGQVFDVATVNMAELGKSMVGRGSNGSNFGV